MTSAGNLGRAFIFTGRQPSLHPDKEAGYCLLVQ